jgi:protein-S-isoprenylcysteine O-methyltransferase Ste14
MIHALPLIGVATFATVGLGWRSWYQYRHFGNSGWRLFRSGSWPQHLRESGLVLLLMLIGAQAAGYAWDAAWLKPLIITPPPTGGLMIWLGALLLFGGIVLMVRAQLDLGASWRIGFDESTRPGLVTRGIYRFSRNPIYVALFAVLTGFLILVPTWISLALLVGTIVTVGNQVQEEERFLRRTYGGDFVAYARRVGRFIPGLGTLDG